MTATQLRGRAKPGQTLPPLRDRRTRILLLASSYLEFVDAVDRDAVRPGKPSSREHRHAFLWGTGSYRDLERCLDELRGVRPVFYGRFWRAYVGPRKPPVVVPTGRTDEMQWKVARAKQPFHEAAVNTPSEQRDAARALLWLERRMPAKIWVPAVVATSEGYAAADAKAYERRREDAA